ncbi:MAG: exodeoxyribonuclease VII large subunit [Lachnospiraceae bacterium]|nr:exodeoxyribonuclease VII large subunit [Lachnospiraceae bacterium]
MNATVFSVSQINRYMKDLVRRDVMLSSVFVRGEISNLKYHPRGHIYFSLKDAGGSISGIMFASEARKMNFRLRDGDTVIVSGYIDVYEEGGRYQLYARDFRREGAGELYEKFLALKQRLLESGMFDERYKMPIPKYAMRIGVVTASSGAAVRDIERVAARRNPYVQLYLYPVQVQGKGASASIAEGIRILDGMGLDLLIVGRGGGSIEDLWAFNEEETARAIFQCTTPVITGIGHETDTTIADYAADLRAPTPSAAAESAVFEIRSFFDRTDRYSARLRSPVEQKIRVYREMLQRYSNVMRYKSPERQISDLRLQAAELEERMTGALTEKIRSAKELLDSDETLLREDMENALRNAVGRLDVLAGRLDSGMKEIYAATDKRLVILIEKMRGLSPLGRLRQGFSFTEDSRGKPVRSIEEVAPGDTVTVYVSDGRLYGRVDGTEKKIFPDPEKGKHRG